MLIEGSAKVIFHLEASGRIDEVLAGMTGCIPRSGEGKFVVPEDHPRRGLGRSYVAGTLLVIPGPPTTPGLTLAIYAL